LIAARDGLAALVTANSGGSVPGSGVPRAPEGRKARAECDPRRANLSHSLVN